MSANDFRQPAMFKRSKLFGTHLTNVSTLSEVNDVHEMLKFSNLKFLKGLELSYRYPMQLTISIRTIDW